MDVRHIFAVFACVFCIVLILATVTGYRHLSNRPATTISQVRWRTRGLPEGSLSGSAGWWLKNRLRWDRIMNRPDWLTIAWGVWAVFFAFVVAYLIAYST